MTLCACLTGLVAPTIRSRPPPLVGLQTLEVFDEFSVARTYGSIDESTPIPSALVILLLIDVPCGDL